MNGLVFKLNNKKYNVNTEKERQQIRMIHNIIHGNDYDDEKPYRILSLFREKEE